MVSRHSRVRGVIVQYATGEPKTRTPLIVRGTIE
jgi:hypothetical protein